MFALWKKDCINLITSNLYLNEVGNISKVQVI